MSQTSRISRHATTTATDNGVTRVTYHKTVVVEFDDKTIRLNSGGWRTATTKARMNQASNQFGLGFHVFQRDFAWFVVVGDFVMYAEHEFSDSMVIDRDTNMVVEG